MCYLRYIIDPYKLERCIVSYERSFMRPLF